MSKKLFSFVLAVMLVLILPVTVSANAAEPLGSSSSWRVRRRI